MVTASEFIMNKKIWIVRRPYDTDSQAIVQHFPIDGLFRVEQNGKLCVVCSHLILKDVFFDKKGGTVRGYIATVKQLDNLHDRDKHGGNDYYPYRVLDFSITRGFVDESGRSVVWAEYLDMVATDQPSMIAIYPSGDLDLIPF